MFALFFNLYYSMFIGSWANYSIPLIGQIIEKPLNGIFYAATSIFGENTINNISDFFGTYTIAGVDFRGYLVLAALVLALITSIGIVVVATKGIKKIFTVFFYGVR